MHPKRIDLTLVQRAIILQVLRDDHPEKWTRAELEQQLSDIEPLTVSDALAGLAIAEVVSVDGESVCAARCVRHLDILGLLGV